MGNSIGGKRKSAKVMQLDGTSFRVKPPAAAADVLRDQPGFQLLESEEVKLLGARARPLAPDAPLRRGRLYFLVALPRRAHAGPMRRAWSGNLRVGARERLESLMLARRSTSDLSSLPAHPSASAPTSPLPSGAASPLPVGAGGAGGATPVRLKMRLPRAQVEKLMGESKDAAEAAAKIMELCGAAMGDAHASARVTPERPPGILRSPRFAKTPEWGAGFMLPPPAPAKTPQRWPTLPRTKEVYGIAPPPHGGFGRPPPVAAGPIFEGSAAASSSNPDHSTAPLTMFYAGSVRAFDSVPMEQAEKIVYMTANEAQAAETPGFQQPLPQSEPAAAPRTSAAQVMILLGMANVKDGKDFPSL
ncbi:hypothetical protein BAE44_0011896 [Dichanthelium oligosanthes]|uniref:Tify domain-containing protein n=1 Tax=Dichanthelium oligosanthes TaxID=888268 RepID=A0A1E5VPU3_9POAL|nr:hypothetical protein BAE44_0011896 [Dichanthelium oligosanthes]